MKYIDAEKLKVEIERRIEETKSMKPSFDQFWGGQVSAFKGVIKIIDSLQQEAQEEEKARKKRYDESFMAYWNSVIDTIDNKRVLPTFKGQLLHDFKNELHTMKQIVGLINHPKIHEGLFDKLALVFAAWGGYHFHPKESLPEDSLQQEQPDNMIQWTGNNLKEVIDFTGKSPRFGEWFNSWEEYENYVHTHNDILKLFCENGNNYDVPIGAWIVKTPDGYNVPSVAKYIQHEQPEVLHFTPLNRLIQKISSENWNDTINNYAKKLRDCLIKEGYLKDAKVLQGYISYMNGNNVPMATMDERVQPEVDLESKNQRNVTK